MTRPSGHRWSLCLVLGSAALATSALGLLSLSNSVIVLIAALTLWVSLDYERRSAQRHLRAAVFAERQRVAQDLHDGIAQDLALIAAFGLELDTTLGAEHPVAVAARRALAVSRGVIDDLSALDHVPAQVALDAVAHELGGRFEMSIDVVASEDVALPAGAGPDIVRITREAIANAARHGGAENVTVSLQRTSEGTMLRVVDDGSGLDDSSGTAPAEGFGLNSMRARATAMGGEMIVSDRDGGGTELVVALP